MKMVEFSKTVEKMWGKDLLTKEIAIYIVVASVPIHAGVLLLGTPHNILSKPLAAFPDNHCRKNGQC